MSIVVPCSCGQKLAATPQMMGRTISCPKCGRMLTVGSSQGASGGASADNSKLLVMVGIGAGVVVGIGAIGLIIFFAFSGRTPAVPVAAAPAPATTPAAPGSPPAASSTPAIPIGAVPAPVASAVPPGGSPSPTTTTKPFAPAQPAVPVRDLTAVKPDFSLKPNDIGAEYKADPAAADAKFKGKIVELECMVLQVFPSAKSASTLTAATFEDFSNTFKCHFAQPDIWKKVAGKSQVKIKGEFRMNDMDTYKFILENCVFTEIGPNPRVVITADELSAEARADRPLFRHRYFPLDLQVKGEVVGIEHNRGDSIRVVLKTSEAPRILVNTQSSSAELEAALKSQFPAGTKVSLVGQYMDMGAAQPQTDVFLMGQILKDE